MVEPSVIRLRPVRLLIGAGMVIALLYAVASLWLYAMAERESAAQAFLLIQKFRVWPPFIDLRWVTATSECSVPLRAIIERQSVGCFPYAPVGAGGLGYPPGSIQLARLLGVQGSHTGWLGFCFGVSLLTVLLLQIWRSFRSWPLRGYATLLVICSFPVQLLLERGNIDIVIFLLFTGIAAFLSCRHPLLGCTAAPLFAFAAVLMKLYPAAGILGFTLSSFRLERDGREPQWPRILIGVAAVAGVVATLPWLFSNGGTAANPGEGMLSHAFLSNSFRDSLSHWRSLSAFLTPAVLRSWLGQCMRVAAVVIGFRCFAASCSPPPGMPGFEDRFLSSHARLTAWTWLGCYGLSSSFDYRLVFALPGLLLLLSRISAGHSVRPKAAAGLLCAALALSFFPGLLSPGLIDLGANHGVLRLAAALHRIGDQLCLPFLAGLLLRLALREAWDPARRQAWTVVRLGG